MTGAPRTCPTRPRVPVMFVGSARTRQPLADVPTASTAGTPAAHTTAREPSSAQAESRGARDARSAGSDRRAIVETATGAHGSVARMLWSGRRLHLVGI